MRSILLVFTFLISVNTVSQIIQKGHYICDDSGYDTELILLSNFKFKYIKHNRWSGETVSGIGTYVQNNKLLTLNFSRYAPYREPNVKICSSKSNSEKGIRLRIIDRENRDAIVGAHILYYNNHSFVDSSIALLDGHNVKQDNEVDWSEIRVSFIAYNEIVIKRSELKNVRSGSELLVFMDETIIDREYTDTFIESGTKHFMISNEGDKSFRFIRYNKGYDDFVFEPLVFNSSKHFLWEMCKNEGVEILHASRMDTMSQICKVELSQSSITFGDLVVKKFQERDQYPEDCLIDLYYSLSEYDTIDKMYIKEETNVDFSGEIIMILISEKQIFESKLLSNNSNVYYHFRFVNTLNK